MKLRISLYALVGLLLVLSLVWLQWRLGLGPFAESPQRVVLSTGDVGILAGGRAVLRLEGVAAGSAGSSVSPGSANRRAPRADLVLRCGSEVEVRLDLAEGDPEVEHCDLGIRLLDLGAQRAELEVRWD